MGRADPSGHPPESRWIRWNSGTGDVRLSELTRLLEVANDPGNPSADEILSIFNSVQRIAVVGHSRDPLKAARRVPSYLATKGYDIVPVNPNALGTRIMGREVVGHLSHVTDPVDMVIVFRPSHEAEGVVRDAAARPERPVIWLQEGIWGGEATREARASGLTVVQNLCAFKAHRAARVV